MIELARNTITADRTMGSQRDMTGTMRTSWMSLFLRLSPRILVSWAYGAQHPSVGRAVPCRRDRLRARRGRARIEVLPHSSNKAGDRSIRLDVSEVCAPGTEQRRRLPVRVRPATTGERAAGRQRGNASGVRRAVVGDA